MNPPRAEHGEGDQPQAGGGAKRPRQLRRTMSLPEVLLWQRLRGRHGVAKFRRQHPIGPYVVDFYCAAAKLAIEIDGEAHLHGTRPDRDDRRAAWLHAHGLALVRVAAIEVLRDVDGVADRLARAALPLHQPAAGPPPHARHGEDFGARED